MIINYLWRVESRFVSNPFRHGTVDQINEKKVKVIQ